MFKSLEFWAFWICRTMNIIKCWFRCILHFQYFQLTQHLIYWKSVTSDFQNCDSSVRGTRKLLKNTNSDYQNLSKIHAEQNQHCWFLISRHQRDLGISGLNTTATMEFEFLTPSVEVWHRQAPRRLRPGEPAKFAPPGIIINSYYH